MTASNPLYSIVVPCYKEAANLVELHRRCMAALSSPTRDIELILVNDGSPDNTLEVAERLTRQDPRVRVLGFSRNFGKEAAMLAGLRAARGEAVAIMDGDLQHPPELLGRMADHLEAGMADQVVARRNRTGDPRVRTALSHLFYVAMNKFGKMHVTDGEGDFRMMSRKALDALLELTERNRFSKGLFSWIGFPTDVIEYENVQREAGGSSWTLRSLFNYAIDGLIAFNEKPLRMVIHIGMLSLTLAVLYLIWLVVEWIRHGVQVPGYLTTIAVIVFLSGVQMVCLGVMGEYVGRTYTETKKRPHYIVATDIGGTVPSDTRRLTPSDVPAQEPHLEQRADIHAIAPRPGSGQDA
ncbi:glycosyltransferase family 2 protein [Acidipropionibacterium virtanenii]|uniref:Glycosyltransferase CsbB n=1 Tax=Acidipropionibacterium virtanenii TaxID=2057246 RepID=A0A344UXG6_9ACTN|nr:glycosyltransferase family 2 protein [Acidipropionibacterium virtanenii]AXE39964.1 Putative glycosyltransferase CsbB [Acidipropionibacterium virtanenii]